MFETYNTRAGLITAVLQLGFGVLSIIFNIFAMVVAPEQADCCDVNLFGYGILIPVLVGRSLVMQVKQRI